MSRYFFHLRRNGGYVPDEEGDEFATADDARANAVSAVRELIAARIKSGHAVVDDQMDVTDETGTLQFTISFHDVVQGQLLKR